MKVLHPMIALAALAMASQAHGECAYPKAPAGIPDGSKATEQEMVDAMKAIKQYDQDVSAYLACLDTEAQARIKDAGDDASPEHIQQIKAIQSKRHNAAVEELQSHATNFNEQVRAFKNKGKKS